MGFTDFKSAGRLPSPSAEGSTPSHSRPITFSKPLKNGRFELKMRMNRPFCVLAQFREIPVYSRNT